ncbi:L-lactate transporter-like isoform X2 [Anneissia japonica]|uniref:L-lactate transporter-like isoform X2 n=1 Tax=Anneissia japonica TaxID=1529436 RepID=UPI001425B544|nr:L-lactate transporter-like isoform X2 [Anneissia japonica]
MVTSPFISPQGNLSMSNMIEYILDQVGWRWTFRIFCGILLIVGIICCTFYIAPKTDEQCVVVLDEKTKRISKRPTNGHLFCFPEFWLFSLSTLCVSVALVFQYVNMASFLESIGLTDQKSATGITLIACGEVFAKIVIMVFASCISFPLIYCLPVSLLVSSILSITLTQTKNTFAIFLISVCYGIPRGVYNGLQFISAMEVFGASRSKTSAKVVMVSSGIGNLAGPFIHGSLYDASGSYYPALYLCTALFFVSSFTMLLTPLWQKYFAPERYMVDYRLESEVKEYQQCSAEYEHLEQMITVV